MNVALGFKAHSGWAALIALGESRDGLTLVDRRRVALIEDGEDWAKQPYHAAEFLDRKSGRDVVKRGIDSAKRIAEREMRAAVERAEKENHRVVGCAVLTGSGMPDWTVDEILAVHFRMHKAEGELFRGVLEAAAQECGIKLYRVPEKDLMAAATKWLAAPADILSKTVAALGKTAGPPWGIDQKDAALAALIALRSKKRRQSLFVR